MGRLSGVLDNRTHDSRPRGANVARGSAISWRKCHAAPSRFVMAMSSINVEGTGTERRNPATLPVFALRDAANRAHSAHHKTRRLYMKQALRLAVAALCVTLVSLATATAQDQYTEGHGGPCHSGPHSSRALQRVHGRREEQHQADLGSREEAPASSKAMASS